MLCSVRNITSFIISIGLLGLLGCEKKIPFNAEISKPKIVVNDEFNPNTSWALHISNSRSVLDGSSLQSISDAEVNIYENEIFVETLIEDGFPEGVYHGSTIPESGKYYRIEVNAPEYDPVTSESHVPYNLLNLNNIDTTFIQEGSNSRTLNMTLDIEDVSPEENYFGIVIKGEYVDDVFGSTIIKDLYMSTSGILFGENDELYDRILVFDDGLFNQSSHSLDLEITGIDVIEYDGIDGEGNAIYRSVPPNKLYISVFTYSKDLYLFKKSIDLYYDSNGDPFAQPVQVYTNVEGGFGVFGGYNEQVVQFDIQ